MNLKELIEQELDANTILTQCAQLQKIDQATDAVGKQMDKTTDPTIVQQQQTFSQLVKKQLAQKKILAAQAQQQAAQTQAAQTQAAQAQTAAQTTQATSASGTVSGTGATAVTAAS